MISSRKWWVPTNHSQMLILVGAARNVPFMALSTLNRRRRRALNPRTCNANLEIKIFIRPWTILDLKMAWFSQRVPLRFVARPFWAFVGQLRWDVRSGNARRRLFLVYLYIHVAYDSIWYMYIIARICIFDSRSIDLKGLFELVSIILA